MMTSKLKTAPAISQGVATFSLCEGRALAASRGLRAALVAHGRPIAAAVVLRRRFGYLAADLLAAAEGSSDALACACKSGPLPEVTALLKVCADPNAALPTSSVAPLFVAASRDRRDMAEALLRAGVDPSRATSRGLTPLWIAAQNGCAELARLLVASGADVGLACAPESPRTTGDAEAAGGTVRCLFGQRS